MKKTLLLLISLLLFLTGCGASDIHSDYLQVALDSRVSSLDVTKGQDVYSLDVVNSLVEGLMCLDANETIIPGMAESYEVSEDGKTYIFHLRDAQWSNGDPVTAYDFEFSWKRFAAANSSYSFIISDVLCIKNGKAVVYGDENGVTADPSTLGIYADDEKTFRLELEAPVSFLPSVTATTLLTPISQSFFERVGEDFYGMSPEYFLCNGPFMLEDYIPGATSVLLKKNERYYDADKVQLPGISFHVVQSEASNMETFRIGELDIAHITGENVAKARKDDFLSRYIREIGFSYINYISMNQTGEVKELNNKNLRLAISRSIDRDYICNNALKDGTMPNYGPVPAGFAFSLTTGGDFSADQSRYAAHCGYDPEKARENFELAKQELGQDTFTFDVLVRTEDKNSLVAMQVIQQQVEKNLEGIKLNLIPLPWAEQSVRLLSHDFVVSVCGFGADYADPMTFLSLWTSDSPHNYGGWPNPAYDQLIADCTTGQYAADYEARWDTLKQAEWLLVEDAGIIPMYRKTQVMLISDRVKGVEYHPAYSVSYKNAVKERL